MGQIRKHDHKYPAIEDLCALIIDGWNWRKISEHYSIPLTTLHSFCSRAENIPHVRTALDMSANAIADKAEQALLNAPSTLPEIQRARELAQYYKWLSAKRSPRSFGDRQEIDYTTTVKTIRVTVPDEPAQLEEPKVKSYVLQAKPQEIEGENGHNLGHSEEQNP